MWFLPALPGLELFQRGPRVPGPMLVGVIVRQPTGTWGSREMCWLGGQRKRGQISGGVAGAWRQIPGERADLAGLCWEVW